MQQQISLLPHKATFATVTLSSKPDPSIVALTSMTTPNSILRSLFLQTCHQLRQQQNPQTTSSHTLITPFQQITMIGNGRQMMLSTNRETLSSEDLN
jgi:hypothetical protein